MCYYYIIKEDVMVTPENIFNAERRKVMKMLGLTAAAVTVPGFSCAREKGEPMPDNANTPEETATTFNNFYEFGFGKSEPARNATKFDTSKWVIKMDGEVKNPMSMSMPELLSHITPEERVYRMRCVEGWSMIIPWHGTELNRLIALLQPTDKAKFVAFESCADPAQMPEVAAKSFPFPYIEGLRLDEAMHPLTILATGAYGKPLLPQSGAPVRLVVPWKYGFKSLKSIVKITFTAHQPPTTWNKYNPHEYGFYANVNPLVPHPRWSQATERIITGNSGAQRKSTELFNGYGEVEELYKGMDLIKNY